MVIPHRRNHRPRKRSYFAGGSRCFGVLVVILLDAAQRIVGHVDAPADVDEREAKILRFLDDHRSPGRSRTGLRHTSSLWRSNPRRSRSGWVPLKTNDGSRPPQQGRTRHLNDLFARSPFHRRGRDGQMNRGRKLTPVSMTLAGFCLSAKHQSQSSYRRPNEKLLFASLFLCV